MKATGFAWTAQEFLMIHGVQVGTSTLVDNFLYARLDLYVLAPLSPEYLLILALMEAQPSSRISLPD